MKSTAIPMLPNGDMEIVFSFDTTGSMAHCLEQVRSCLQEIMERLFADIPGLKVALFAHGDYCDAANYVTKYINFTNDVQQLCKFASTVTPTSGGDCDECYELVLHQVRTKLKWTPGSQRALVMIGDAQPHGVNYKNNKLKLDWKKETRLLNDMGVRIYGVNCGCAGTEVDKFFNFISDETGGRMIKLDDISSITSMLMAVCYREKGPDALQAFEKEYLANKQKITKTLSGVFDALRDNDDDDDDDEPDVASPAPGTSGIKRKTSPKKPKATVMKTEAKRKRTTDEADTTPAVKRRRASVESGASSSSSSSRKSATPKSTHKMARRSHKHPMNLRKRTVVLNGRVEKKPVSKSPAKRRSVKINRESLLAKQFLEELEWTPWRLAMTRLNIISKTWSSRPTSHTGMRKDSLVDDTENPAVYEFAVATPGSPIKNPVYASVTKGFSHQSWESKFLGRPHLQKQLDCILERNCQIYARSAPVVKSASSPEDVNSAVAELRHLLATTYDYAWQEHYNIETRTYHHRRLYKNGVLISE